ncbi:uncharacterized [Tachysurus ichikawai]
MSVLRVKLVHHHSTAPHRTARALPTGLQTRLAFNFQLCSTLYEALLCRYVTAASSPRRSTRQYARAEAEELPEIFPVAVQSECASSGSVTHARDSIDAKRAGASAGLNIAAHEGNGALKLSEIG